jgi:hypothetical protein
VVTHDESPSVYLVLSSVSDVFAAFLVLAAHILWLVGDSDAMNSAESDQ